MIKRIIGWFSGSKPRKKKKISEMSLSELEKEEKAIRAIFPQVEGIRTKQAKANKLLSDLQKYYWNRILMIGQRRKDLERSNRCKKT